MKTTIPKTWSNFLNRGKIKHLGQQLQKKSRKAGLQQGYRKDIDCNMKQEAENTLQSYLPMVYLSYDHRNHPNH